MPSKSEKQRRFMRAAANNSDFAKKAKIPQSVAKEFEKADNRKEGKKTTKQHGELCLKCRKNTA